MVYQVAICDDEESYVEFTKDILSRLYPDILEYHCYYSGENLLRADVRIQHSLIILDIQIGDMNGMEVARRIRRYNEKAVLVFCSGVFNPTPETFVMSPYRYIQKQDPVEKAQRYLTDAVEKMMEECQAMLTVECAGEQYHIHLNEVMYIDKSKNNRVVHFYSGSGYRTGEKTYTTDLTFDELMQRYEKYGLAYPHNSYLINLRYVKQSQKGSVTLKDGTVLTVARSKAKDFLKRLNNYWGNKY